MPCSYKFTIPDIATYEAFKNDITKIKQDIKFDREITFKGEEQTAFFDCDSRALWLLFDTKLGDEGMKKYPFFCCPTTDYKKHGCERLENGNQVEFIVAYYPEDIKLNQLPSRPHASSISNLLMMEEIFDRALIRLHSFHDGGY